MQWKTVKNNLGSTVYSLWSNGQKMLTLARKESSNTLYLEAEDGTKRLFHYRKKGLLHKKIVLENEYGVSLGNLQREGLNEYVELNDKRYFIHYKNETHKEVEIVDEDNNKSLATLSFDANDTYSSYSLLLVSCLYLYKNNFTQVPAL
ncbi:MAG: hypothetical protein ACK5NK_01380 [Niabella sp.]